VARRQSAQVVESDLDFGQVVGQVLARRESDAVGLHGLRAAKDARASHAVRRDVDTVEEERAQLALWDETFAAREDETRFDVPAGLHRELGGRQTEGVRQPKPWQKEQRDCPRAPRLDATSAERGSCGHAQAEARRAACARP